MRITGSSKGFAHHGAELEFRARAARRAAAIHVTPCLAGRRTQEALPGKIAETFHATSLINLSGKGALDQPSGKGASLPELFGKVRPLVKASGEALPFEQAFGKALPFDQPFRKSFLKTLVKTAFHQSL